MGTVTRRNRPASYLVVGGLCGLTWAAGFRGSMAQLVWGESMYTWPTVVLVLLPGWRSDCCWVGRPTCAASGFVRRGGWWSRLRCSPPLCSTRRSSGR
jgi:hypothetical protein